MSSCTFRSIFITQHNQQLYFAVKFRNLVFCAHDRIQVPKSGRYISRFFHRVEISPVTAKSSNTANEQCICLASTQQQSNNNQKYSQLFWLSYNDLCEPQVLSSLAGPEPKMIAEQYLEDLEVSRMSVPNGSRGSRGQPSLQGQQVSQTKVASRKWTNAERFGTDYATDDMTAVFLPPNGSAHQLMVCTSLDRSDVLSLYNEFVLHCYPSIAMGQLSLGRFLSEKLAVSGMSAGGNDALAGAAKVAKYFRYACWLWRVLFTAAYNSYFLEFSTRTGSRFSHFPTSFKDWQSSRQTGMAKKPNECTAVMAFAIRQNRASSFATTLELLQLTN